MKKIQLNLGCGVWLRKGFINVDNFFTEEDVRSKKGAYVNAVIEDDAKFVKADILHLPFEDNYADYVELMNVIEHFPMYRVSEYVKEIYRVMKPGAKLVILTNDMTGLAIDWLQMITQNEFDIKKYYDVAEPIFGNQYANNPGEVHKCPFTPLFMNYVLIAAGFKSGSGTIYLVPKGTLIPKIGTLPADNKKAARNNLIVVEIKK